jgi:hypothetical protein
MPLGASWFCPCCFSETLPDAQTWMLNKYMSLYYYYHLQESSAVVYFRTAWPCVAVDFKLTYAQEDCSPFAMKTFHRAPVVFTGQKWYLKGPEITLGLFLLSLL